MLRCLYVPPKGQMDKAFPMTKVKDALKDPDCLVWISLERPSQDEFDLVLKEIFQFHPLSIEDCQTTTYQPPKVDDFGHYLFLIIHAIHANGGQGELETDELDIFLGNNFLVTSHHEARMSPVEFVWERVEKDERKYQNGPDFLCHSILDKLVDEFMPILDNMDEEIEVLEDQVLEKPRPEVLERILKLKHSIMALRRIISPQREIINRLSRDDFPMIDRQSRIYYRDIYDHLVRIQDLSETIRDLVTGAMDIYLNSTSLRLNEIMKALTIVSTIFLPLSFVAGIYGMNFEYLPEVKWPLGYLFFWAIVISMFVGMLTYFKKRKWF